VITSEHLLPILFLAVVFVGFALVHRNRRDSCVGCSGDCDKSRCEKKKG
jgi:hypothetical protein